MIDREDARIVDAWMKATSGCFDDFADGFIAGFAAGRASRTPGTYTAKMLACAKRWKQHLKLTDAYQELLDGFISELDPK